MSYCLNIRLPNSPPIIKIIIYEYRIIQLNKNPFLSIINNSMNAINLISEILANPSNLVAYRQLIDFYKKENLMNESNAFEELIRSSNANSPDSDKKQFEHN